MNSINPLNNAQFPADSDTWVFVQNMILLASKLAQLGGANYILEGCVETSGNVSSGILVINGELIPLEGGTKLSNIHVETTNRNVNVGTTVFNNVYTEKVAKFGSAVENYVWADFVRFTDMKALLALVNLKADKQEPAWHTFTDVELHVGIDKDNSELKIRKNNNGTVSITGYFRITNTACYIFIPSGYEPSSIKFLNCIHETNYSTSNAYFRVGLIDANYGLVFTSNEDFGVVHIECTYFLD